MVFIKPQLCVSIQEKNVLCANKVPLRKTFPQHRNERIKPLRQGGGEEEGGRERTAANHVCSVSCKSKTDVWRLQMCEH